MNAKKELDIQIRSISFVVDRPQNPSWKYSVEKCREHYVLAYAQSGEACYTIGNEKIHVKKGNVIFLKPHQLYVASSDKDNPWSFFSAAFIPEFYDGESKLLFDSLPDIFRQVDSARVAIVFAELNRVWANKSTGYLTKCRSLILDIFYILMSEGRGEVKSSAHYSKISEIADMMRENYAESYSIQTLCKLSGLSSSHFRTLFKEITGLSALQFQNKLKIDRAKDLIISGSCNVTEAAEAVGITNVYYFSRLFRKLTGKSPSEYINR